MMKWKKVAEERVNGLKELPVGGAKEIWISDTSHKIFDECFPPMRLAKTEHNWRVDIRNELRKLLKARERGLAAGARSPQNISLP